MLYESRRLIYPTWKGDRSKPLWLLTEPATRNCANWGRLQQAVTLLRLESRDALAPPAPGP